MGKAVLIAIRPKWCELIANGKKTVEVRKNSPKLKTPFKCYIYCTKPSKLHQTICGCMVLNSDELFRHPRKQQRHIVQVCLQRIWRQTLLQTQVTTKLFLDIFHSVVLQLIDDFKSKNKNVFVKPNEQSKVYLDYAMARKGRIKSNICW